MSIRTILGLAAGLTLASAAGAAMAQPNDDDDIPTVRELVVSAGAYAPPHSEIRAIGVQADDLNLFGQPGAFRLVARIKAAAEKVCAPEPSYLDLPQAADHRRCVDDAVNRAVHDTGEPLVIAIYELQARDPRAGLPPERVETVALR